MSSFSAASRPAPLWRRRGFRFRRGAGSVRGDAARFVDQRAAAVLAPQVILVIAREDLDRAIGNFDHARGEFVDEVAVVGNEHHGAVELLQRGEQHVLRAHVEMVGGLVEQKKVSRHHQHPCQRVAIPLSAGQDADAS